MKTSKSTTNPYRTVFTSIRSIVKADGLIGLQKGLSSALAFQFVMNSTRLGLYQTIDNHGNAVKSENINADALFLKFIFRFESQGRWFTVNSLLPVLGRCQWNFWILDRLSVVYGQNAIAGSNKNGWQVYGWVSARPQEYH